MAKQAEAEETTHVYEIKVRENDEGGALIEAASEDEALAKFARSWEGEGDPYYASVRRLG